MPRRQVFQHDLRRIGGKVSAACHLNPGVVTLTLPTTSFSTQPLSNFIVYAPFKWTCLLTGSSSRSRGRALARTRTKTSSSNFGTWITTTAACGPTIDLRLLSPYPSKSLGSIIPYYLPQRTSRPPVVPAVLHCGDRLRLPPLSLLLLLIPAPCCTTHLLGIACGISGLLTQPGHLARTLLPSPPVPPPWPIRDVAPLVFPGQLASVRPLRTGTPERRCTPQIMAQSLGLFLAPVGVHPRQWQVWIHDHQLITDHTPQHPPMPLAGAMPANAHLVKKLERTVNTTAVSPDGHNTSQLMDQLKREAEDLLAQYGGLLKDSSSCPTPTVTDLLQPRNDSHPTPSHSSLVQRTTKSGGQKITPLPYPTTHTQAKKTRVPGRYVCTWQGCDECKSTQVTFHPHII